VRLCVRAHEAGHNPHGHAIGFQQKRLLSY